MTTTELTTTEARKIASEWHSGQGSPLYAFSSTGTILPGAEAEIARTLIQSEAVNDDPEGIAELRSLGRFISENA